jgi:VWFA-related protein
MRLSTSLTVLSVFFFVLTNGLAFIQAQSTSTPANLVTATLTVTNSKGRLVGGLTKDDFTISDEKAHRPIRSFGGLDEPMDVGILVDISGSMNSTQARPQGVGRKEIIECLSTFVHLSNRTNRYFLMSFANQPHLLSDWTTDINPSLGTIPAADVNARTAFYDALAATINKVKTGIHRKRVVLVITDGVDSGSSLKPEEIRQVLRANDVLVYFMAVITYPANIGSLSPLPVPLANLMNARLITAGTQTLIDFAEITGGRALRIEDAKEMNLIANIVATELRHQYRVEFEANSGGPGKWRRVKATIKPRAGATSEFRNLKLRTRQGYYSTSDGKQRH